MSSVVRARTVGTSVIELPMRTLTPRTELTFALAAYLCVRAGERLARTHLISLFWPNTDEARGRHSLRQLLYRLRGIGLNLVDDGDDVYLKPDNVDCDVHRLLSGGELDASLTAAFRATPEFLPHVRRDISDAHRSWLDSVAARITNAYTHTCLVRIREAREQGRWEQVTSWADAILAVDPLNEEATLSKAESIAMAGSKAVALAIIDSYIEELGPNATRLALPATLLRRRISERMADWGSGGPRELPLFGREDLMARLTQQLESVSTRRGHVTLLVGPAGVGKSRLCLELRGAAELRGFRCVEVKADIAGSARPFSLIVRLAFALRDLPGSAGATPQAMTVLKRLTQKNEGRSAVEALLSTDISIDYLTWSLTEVLSAVCAESKVLLIIDDLQHADTGSATVLAGVATAVQAQRIAVVLTTRPGFASVSPAFDSATGALRLQVAPLTDDAAMQLAAALANSLARNLSTDDLQAIIRAAGGNPLFLRELTTLHESAAPRTGLPRSLRHLIEARLSQLPSNHTRVLRLITLLGPLATLSRVRELVASDALALADVVEQLESEGIVTAGELGLLRVHECWQDGIRQGLPRATLGAISLECAEQLVGADGDADPVDRLWRASDLYTAAGCQAEARECLANAGEALLARGLARQAAAAFGGALSHARGEFDRTRLLSKRVRANAIAGEYQQAIADARLGLELSPQSGPRSVALRAELLAALAESLWRDGQPHQVALDDLAAAAAEADIPVGIRHFTCLAGLRLVFIDLASSHAERFAEIIERSTEKDGPTLCGLLGRLVFASECGSEAEIRSACGALERFPMSGEPSVVRAKSIRYRATALRFIGDINGSRPLLEHALNVSVEAGELEEAYDCALSLVFLALDDGDLEAAERAFSKSAAVIRHTPPFFQQRQSRHAEIRLLLQRGRFAESLALSKRYLPLARADGMGRRKAADLASAALSAAHCGDSDLATELAELTLQTLRLDRPCSVLDFSAEATVRALRVLNRRADADRVAMEYASRRRAAYPRALPAYMTELAQAMLALMPQGSASL